MAGNADGMEIRKDDYERGNAGYIFAHNTLLRKFTKGRCHLPVSA